MLYFFIRFIILFLSKGDNMKLILILFFLLLPFVSKADNVILMIGDGMGTNHLVCAQQTKPIFIPSLPVKGTIHTRSANSETTDSAASATAYACGTKTNNLSLGKLPNQENCVTLAEKAIQHGLSVGIYSTDHSTGATPSAFYAHTTNRHDKETIEQYKQSATQTMDIVVPVDKISDIVPTKLQYLSNKSDKNGFFALFEGAKIDTASHHNNLNDMKTELYDFDLAVMHATDFVYYHPNTTLIVLADHETGGLTADCQYTRTGHTGVDVPVHAYGQHAHLFRGEQDNTDIHHKINQILFSSGK